MQLSLINILRCFLGGGYGEKKITEEINKADHGYIKGDIQQRGPCPGTKAPSSIIRLATNMVFGTHL